MPTHSILLRSPAYKGLVLLFIALCLCLNTAPLPIPTSEPHSFGVATAAPIPLRDRSIHASTNNSAKPPREIELVSSTSQGVTIQLVIPKSDFSIAVGIVPQVSHTRLALQSAVSKREPVLNGNLLAESQSISFPGCNFIPRIREAAPTDAIYTYGCPPRCGFPSAGD